MNIQTTINYVSESISLLRHMGKQKSYKTLCADAARSLPSDSADRFPPKDLIIFYEKIEKQFRTEFKTDWNEFLYYFAPISDGDHWDCLGRLLLLWEEFNHADQKSYDVFSTELAEMESEEYYRRFAITLQGFDETLRDNSQFVKLEKPEEILTYILKLDFPKEVCLKIEEGMIHYQKHISKLLEFISRTIALIQPYEDEMLEFIQHLKSYWENQIGDRDFLEYMYESSETFRKLPENPYGYIVTPEIFAPFQTGISVSPDDITGLCTAPFILSMGICFCDAFAGHYFFDFPPSEYSEELYLEILKQISDPTRFEILSYIKDTPAYGNELANHLNLTTATVSHHMYMLMNNSLVDTEFRGNRTYYYSNKETIRACFRHIKNEFRL